MSIRAVLKLAVAALSMAVGSAAAQAPTLKIGLPSLSMYTMIYHVAQDRGFFDKEGIKAELTHFESGSINMRALLGRAVDVSEVETALILGAAGSGADLTVFGTQCQGVHFALYAKKEIKDLKSLQGRSFGISGIGGLPHVVILALMDRQRLDSDRVQMLTVGGTGARLKSLIAGKIDATLGEYSPTVEADANLHRLLIVSQELPLYMAQGLTVWTDTLPGKRDALERMQRALVGATRWAYDNKADFVAAARKHLPTSAEELGQVYDFYMQARVWAINGELDPKRLAYMQELGLKTKTQPKPVNLDKLVLPELTDKAIAPIGKRDYPAKR